MKTRGIVTKVVREVEAYALKALASCEGLDFGTLTRTQKMPGHSFSLQALVTCPAGRRLSQVEGSVCSKCYALRGRYYGKNVKRAQQRRLDIIKEVVREFDAGNPIPMARWVAGMAGKINNTRVDRYFRWHDSGDIFCPQYAGMIVLVCRLTPEFRHFIPTKMSEYVPWLEGFSPNIVVRYSLPMIDNEVKAVGHHMALAASPERYWNQDTPIPEGMRVVWCPAYTRTPATCEECRACWDKNVDLIVYKQH